MVECTVLAALAGHDHWLHVLVRRHQIQVPRGEAVVPAYPLWVVSDVVSVPLEG